MASLNKKRAMAGWIVDIQGGERERALFGTIHNGGSRAASVHGLRITALGKETVGERTDAKQLSFVSRTAGR
jgi:hypothetical protein